MKDNGEESVRVRLSHRDSRIGARKFRIQNSRICPCRAVRSWQLHEDQCLLKDDWMGFRQPCRRNGGDETLRWKNRRRVREKGNSKSRIQISGGCPSRAVTSWKPHEGLCLHNDDGMGIPPATQAEWRDTFCGGGAAWA